jgi:membrane protein
MRLLRHWHRVARESIERFNADDGWPIASHVALSTLMALFPFLIVLAALDSFVASVDLADAAAGLLLKSWPREVSERIAPDAQAVLGTARGGVLGLGIAFAVFFAATGVESMRIGLNRAYRVRETRSWGLLRLESIAWVIVGAIAYLALALPIVLAPLIFEAARESAPGLARVELKLTLLRYAIASFLLVSALVLVHKWLPAGRRGFTEITPGVVATVVLWLVCGELFGRYLADFAHTYVSYYAGLASGMIALSFLYLASLAFVFGGEINATCMRLRDAGEGTGAEG